VIPLAKTVLPTNGYSIVLPAVPDLYVESLITGASGKSIGPNGALVEYGTTRKKRRTAVFGRL
jgi:hypothetical protein